MGQFGQEQGAQGKDDNLVKLSPIGVGGNVSPNLRQTHKLAINAILVGEQLHLSFAYNECEFELSTINKLMDCYRRQLLRITALCSQMKEKQVTPSDLTYDRLSIETVDQLNQQYRLADIYPLSPMQQGFLYQFQFDKDADYYVAGSSYKIRGNFKPELMEKSFNKIAERYDILRTVFKTGIADMPLQLVKQEGRINYDYQDISQAPGDEKARLVAAAKEKIRPGTFDLLGDEPPMLLRILKLAASEYEVIWHYHHILMDGWCLNILFKEILYIYSQYEKGKTPRLEPVVPYKNYIKWLGRQDQAAARHYWKNYLEDYNESLSLPGKPKPQGK